MRYTLFPAFLFATALAVTPALAQSSNQQSQKSQTGQQQAQGSQGGQQGSQSGSQAHAMTQQKLQSSLEKAGFTDVTIVDAAYLVHAKTADGEQVLMSINPPLMGQSAANTQRSGSGQSGSGQSGSGGTTKQ